MGKASFKAFVPKEMLEQDTDHVTININGKSETYHEFVLIGIKEDSKVVHVKAATIDAIDSLMAVHESIKESIETAPPEVLIGLLLDFLKGN